MKILILSSRFPYPIEKGDKLRLYHQIKELSRNHEIYLVSLSTETVNQDSLEAIAEFCEEIKVFKISKWFSSLKALIAISGNQPSQVSYFYRKSIHRQLKQICKGWNPDLIYCQLVRMAPYAKSLPYPKVIDFMDAFSISFHRRALHEGLLKRSFFKIESRKLKIFEDELLKQFPACTIISDADKSEIGNGINNAHLHVISNGIDTNYFRQNNENIDYEILFVGNMGYHPNVVAAKYLVQRLIPKLGKSMKLLIAGARPTKEVKNLQSSQVFISGWMEDIRNAYDNAGIFVAPIFSGAGQQNKILEAMSMKKICITTPLVNKAIGAVHGEHLFIAETEIEFVERIRDIIKNKGKYAKIGSAARNFVNANFSWETENYKLEHLFSKVKNQ